MNVSEFLASIPAEPFVIKPDDVVKALSLKVEVGDQIFSVPFDFDFSTLSMETISEVLTGTESPTRLAAEFLGRKANETMGLDDEDLGQVIEAIEQILEGDDSRVVSV